ncbi:hypothetical protein E4U44_002056 [Claviceps purpurea]|nr:hypothetical protein E4U44_002056 [Claviceps purpurea]
MTIGSSSDPADANTLTRSTTTDINKQGAKGSSRERLPEYLKTVHDTFVECINGKASPEDAWERTFYPVFIRAIAKTIIPTANPGKQRGEIETNGIAEQIRQVCVAVANHLRRRQRRPPFTPFQDRPAPDPDGLTPDKIVEKEWKDGGIETEQNPGRNALNSPSQPLMNKPRASTPRARSFASTNR